MRTGTARSNGELRDLTVFNASAGWAAGGLVSTAGDMARYWRALLGGKLLAPAQLDAMKTTVPVGDGYPGRYGLGLIEFTRHQECGVLWGNGGDLPGFSSEFFNSEDGTIQAGVIVNVNPIPDAGRRRAARRGQADRDRVRPRPRALLAGAAAGRLDTTACGRGRPCPRARPVLSQPPRRRRGYPAHQRSWQPWRSSRDRP